MSASPNFLPPHSPDVLGELLHSLSQPLTGLRCSLELSIAEAAERQQENVAAALQQTEQVIGMIQLMREYLDAGQPGPEPLSSALAPVIRSAIEDLATMAAVRDIRLRLVGTCAATVPVPESRLRLALQYLIVPLIDGQPIGGKVMLLLGEGPAGTVLRVEAERGLKGREQNTTGSQTTLHRVRIAIARRALESAGASLVFGDDVHPAGFVLRIPRRVDAAR